jgi:hypothetical protein
MEAACLFRPPSRDRIDPLRKQKTRAAHSEANIAGLKSGIFMVCVVLR